ncbi:MAG: response regulator transcription factor [Clostridia bacterium]|nr:response regulator transcription factor [Clostridia bacterium]
MIKLMIADDSRILRNNLKTILEQDKTIKVIGCAADGMEAYQFCCTNKPDIVLMDIRMPICDGVEGTRLIKEKDAFIKVIILTTFNDDEYIEKALEYGADGYILKGIGDEELRSAIQSTAKGLSVVQQSVFSRIKNSYKSIQFKRDERQNRLCLSEREKEIIKEIMNGKSNKEIANQMFLAEGSVRNIISTLLTKLQLKDRTQLAVFALKNNLV